MNAKVKNFIRGMGSVVELFPSDNGRSSIVKMRILSDEEAFKKDLEQVAKDMQFVIKTTDKIYNISHE